MRTESIRVVLDAHKGHFFDRDTKRFFKSRVAEQAYVTDDRKWAFFTTSEKNGRNRRFYSVRKVDMHSGDVDTHGAFQGYDTRAQADRAARKACELLGGAAPVGGEP